MMLRIGSLSCGLPRILSLPYQSLIAPIRKIKKSSQCGCYPPDKKPCFDISNVSIEYGNQCHSKMTRSFLFSQFWPREPTIAALWMSLNCPYLDILTDRYSHSGDRLLAFEHVKRTNEQKLIGVLVAHKVFPWMADELEEWAHNTASRPERHRMYFTAHCLRSPNLFKKYHTDLIYDIQVVVTATEVAGLGVATMLLQRALDSASELRYPLVQVVATSQYLAKVCEKCKMNRAWTMEYSDYIDASGQRVFFPRRPHNTVAVYIKYFDPKIGAIVPCKPPY